MSNEIEKTNLEHKHIKESRVLSGVLLVVAGLLVLGRKMGLPIPEWVFTWQMALIVIGALLLIKSNFKNAGGFIMIFVGSIFMIDQFVTSIDLHDYILPIVLIGAGIIFIIRPKPGHHDFRFGGLQGRFNRMDRRWQQSSGFNEYNNKFSDLSEDTAAKNYTSDDAEYLEVNAVFGGVKKMILSKNFKGGEINTFMGGAEINMLQADVVMPVVLEVNNVFGGTKLVLPSNWDVKSELTTVFGGVEDKRSINAATPDRNKVIVLKGTCVFGGLEIRNF